MKVELQGVGGQNRPLQKDGGKRLKMVWRVLQLFCGFQLCLGGRADRIKKTDSYSIYGILST